MSKFSKSEFSKKVSNPLYAYAEEESKRIRGNFPKLREHIAFCAGTQSGKTFLAQTLLADVYNGIYDQIFIFSPNTILNYQDVFEIPDEFIVGDPDFPTVKEIYELVSEEYKHRKGKLSTLFLFDDCGTRFRYWGKNGSLFIDFLAECRHANVTCWILEQYSKYLTPGMRANILAYFIYPTLSPEELKGLGESSFGVKQLAAHMKAVVNENEATDNQYGCMYWRRKNKKFDTAFYCTVEEDGIQLFPISEV